MKLFVSADLEGVACVSHATEVTRAEPAGYEAARQQMTAEVAAACAGGFDAGATEVVVRDAHWTGRNLDATRLAAPDGRSLRLIRGWSGHPFAMVEGLDAGFAAVAFVGYHSAAGRAGNPLAHTLTSRQFAHVALNGATASEFLIHAWAAALVQVPVVFLAGDQALCDEARERCGSLVTVATFAGQGHAVTSLLPGEAARQIRAGVGRALDARSGWRPVLPPEFHAVVRFTTAAEAYRKSFYPQARLATPPAAPRRSLPQGVLMSSLVIRFDPPFIVFFGDIADEVYAKTGLGLVQWRRDDCLGQWRLPGCSVDAGVPDLSLANARAAGARTVIIGSAAVGGGIPERWVAALCEAAAAGLDIVAGLHIRLATLPGLAAAAERGGARLIDVRVPPPGLPVGTGRKRRGLRLLTVGTDCACGKKYTALALDRELRARGLASDFRATGQTGIMIAGQGLPLDAVVSDFVTGAAEVLSPDNAPDHWDLVEGQGAIFHPGYLQVTIGLLVGSQPDAFVVCHDPLRRTISGWPDFPLPSIAQVIERTVAIGRLTNPAIRCVGVALNTAKIPATERGAVLARHAAETGLPVVDPLIDGVGAIVARMLAEFPA